METRQINYKHWLTTSRACFVFTILSLTFLFPIFTAAQNKSIENPSILQLKQVEGVYDSQEGTFYSQYIDKENIKIIHRFQIKKFVDGLGITEYYYTNSDTQYESRTKYGLIDTNGYILIPCIYERVLITGSKNNYGFYTNDSLGIISLEKGVILKHPIKNSQPKKENVLRKENGFHSFKNSTDYIVLRINDFLGVYSFDKEKYIIPTIYDKITLYDNIAVCQSVNNFVFYDCITECKSEIFKEIHTLNEQKYFFVRLKDGKSLICTDPTSPLNSIYTKLQIDEALEFNNRYLIATRGDRFGLIDEFGNISVPFVYDDIYFFDKELLLLKKDDLWAISDYKHKLLTQFQFINIDKQNQINLNNFISFSGIDTTDKVIMKYFDYESGYGKFNEYLLAEIKKSLISIKSELYSRKISKYDDFVYPIYVLGSKKGFQLITVKSKEELIIDSLYWDNVYMIPRIYDYPFEIGVQKGDKFGYYNSEKNIKTYLKYDGIYFYYKLFFYESILYSGTHSERSPFTFVKKGNVFIRSSYPKTNWIEKLTSPRNYSCTYQGKPKWRKYMKEEEFLEKRKREK